MHVDYKKNFLFNPKYTESPSFCKKQLLLKMTNNRFFWWMIKEKRTRKWQQAKWISLVTVILISSTKLSMKRTRRNCFRSTSRVLTSILVHLQAARTNTWFLPILAQLMKYFYVVFLALDLRGRKNDCRGEKKWKVFNSAWSPRTIVEKVAEAYTY